MRDLAAPTMSKPTETPDDAALARMLQRSRSLLDAPEPVIQRAIDIFQARARSPAPAAPATGGLRRLAAMLGFDSATVAPQAAGLRSATAPRAARAPRQLLYTAEGRDVDLRLVPQPDGRHWSVSGQVLGPDLRGRAELRCGGTVRDAAWDEMAEFRFDSVPAGPCTLLLQGADWEVELPPIELPG